MTLTTLLAGLGLLAITSFDLIMVTIGATTRHTVTQAIARSIFAGLRAIARIGGVRALTVTSGPLVMIAVALFWIGGFWIGWSLIYAGAAGSITMDAVGIEPEGASYPAHVGHLLSTLGGATTRPAGPAWNLVGVLVGVNGMVALTLAVSFLLTTRQTVQMGRAFAALVDAEPDVVEPRIERLADLVAGLQAAPFALWYVQGRADRRLPDALLVYARAAAEQGGSAWRRVRSHLRDLPHLPDDDDGDVLAMLERWADAHRLSGAGERQMARPAD